MWPKTEISNAQILGLKPLLMVPMDNPVAEFFVKGDRIAENAITIKGTISQLNERFKDKVIAVYKFMDSEGHGNCCCKCCENFVAKAQSYTIRYVDLTKRMES